MNGKIVILGAGHVGSHVARALAAAQIGHEIVLTDCVPGKAEAQAMDIADALIFPPSPVHVRAGTAADCADADVTVIAIGKPREKGQTRLDLLEDSVRMIHGLAGELARTGTGGPVISITNPCDIIADCLRRDLHQDRFTVFGTGTLLDTARLIRTLSGQTHQSADRIEAFVLGEHGDSSMIPFSALRIAGRDARSFPGFDERSALKRTHEIGMDIINGKGSTEFGIGQCTAHLIRAILTDSKAVLPLSVLLEGEYALTGIHCGVPCVVGKRGIESVVELSLTAEERQALENSADILRQYTRRAEEITAGLE